MSVFLTLTVKTLLSIPVVTVVGTGYVLAVPGVGSSSKNLLLLPCIVTLPRARVRLRNIIVIVPSSSLVRRRFCRLPSSPKWLRLTKR